jgi:hypothetical protein
VILCFSVLHHLPEKERFQILDAISNRCRAAYIEMDGPYHGKKALEMFFWRVEQIAETNDRYGHGRLKRKTFYCSNHDGDRTFKNLKTRDFVFDRGLFLCTRSDGRKTVIKRDRTGSRPSHTWLKTGVGHERSIYEKHPSPLFPRLLDAGDGEYRWIELEFIERQGVLRREAVDELCDFLEREKLFVVDFRLDDSFIPSDGSLRMIDLESIFPWEGSWTATVARCAQDPKRLPSHLPSYDSYEKQRRALKRTFYGIK